MTKNWHAYVMAKLLMGIGVTLMLVARLFYPESETTMFWVGLSMIAIGWFYIPKWPTPFNGVEL